MREQPNWASSPRAFRPTPVGCQHSRVGSRRSNPTTRSWDTRQRQQSTPSSTDLPAPPPGVPPCPLKPPQRLPECAPESMKSIRAPMPSQIPVQTWRAVPGIFEKVWAPWRRAPRSSQRALVNLPMESPKVPRSWATALLPLPMLTRRACSQAR